MNFSHKEQLNWFWFNLILLACDLAALIAGALKSLKDWSRGKVWPVFRCPRGLGNRNPDKLATIIHFYSSHQDISSDIKQIALIYNISKTLWHESETKNWPSQVQVPRVLLAKPKPNPQGHTGMGRLITWECHEKSIYGNAHWWSEKVYFFKR